MDQLNLTPREYLHEGKILHVFNLSVNGELISDQCPPFTAADAEFNTHICPYCFVESAGKEPNCAPPDIFVRKYADFVIWYLNDSELAEFMHGPLNDHRSWSFDKREYERVLSGDAGSLPDLDIGVAIRLANHLKIFPRELGLYTIPDLPDDPQGRYFLDQLQFIIDAKNLELSSLPPDSIRIRIGIETPGVPECVVDLGMIDGNCALLFLENPGFPLWVTSPEINRRMRQFIHN